MNGHQRPLIAGLEVADMVQVPGPGLRVQRTVLTSGVGATEAIGRPGLRVHDPRHAAASLWLASGADPKVVQRVLGHASAAMTMDLYGHLIDQNLWDAPDRIGGTAGAPDPDRDMQKAPGRDVPRA